MKQTVAVGVIKLVDKKTGKDVKTKSAQTALKKEEKEKKKEKK